MEYRTRVPVSVRLYRMYHGCGWLQGQMVRIIPRPHSQCVQRRCKQLVECPLRASRKGLP